MLFNELDLYQDQNDMLNHQGIYSFSFSIVILIFCHYSCPLSLLPMVTFSFPQHCLAFFVPFFFFEIRGNEVKNKRKIEGKKRGRNRKEKSEEKNGYFKVDCHFFIFFSRNSTWLGQCPLLSQNWPTLFGQFFPSRLG